MKGLIVFLTLCISSVWLVPTNSINKPVPLRDGNSRIINGQNAVAGQFPWQAAIFYLVSGTTYFCGGSLIGTQWILTAGQCVVNATLFQIQLGSNTLQDIDSNRVIILSNIYILHPSYSAATMANDIGVIQIASVTLNTYIQTIPIWHTVLQPNVIITISGFGKTSDASTTISNELKFVSMTTISNSQCTLTYGSIIQSYMVCAVGATIENFCAGDSGGPATVTVNGTTSHVAIPSFITSLGCESGYPSGFTRSLDFLTWINSVTGLSL